MTARQTSQRYRNAIDEIYRDTDKDDARARRVLFFPAGTYRINAALKIPPYAHLVGEGPDKTIIKEFRNRRCHGYRR